jgi:murein DD-endopeptidase MepM/ murein hydrolase activator NlpD
MQDILATRLLPHSGTEALDRQTVQLLQKGTGNRAADNPEQLRAVAKEFEALFLNYMLSVMRETIDESGLTEKGPGASVYTELFDQEVARSLAGRGALGISNLLIQKLSGQASTTKPESSQDSASKAPAAAAPALQTGAGEEIPDFRMPVQARVSSAYGLRQDPFTHQARIHRGVDIAAPEGMEVHVACAGVVVSAGYEKGYGNTVLVQHPGGFETRYAHLNAVKVNVGDQVQVNGIVGTVGSTGRSTGPHLHFEVVHNGNQVDPEALLPH